MKSVIAQGSTVVKAIEEALKKAEMPTQFFVKLLEDAQSGFLGFGAKKAKVALFFKQKIDHNKNKNLLSQDSYENLFNSQALSKQIEEELKNLDTAKVSMKFQTQKEHKPKINPTGSNQTRSAHVSHPKSEHNNSINRNAAQSPKPQITQKQPETKNVNAGSVKKSPTINRKEAQPSQGEHKHMHQAKQNQQMHTNANTARPHSKPLSQTKLTIRPLLQKNNDPKKSE